MKAFAIEAYNQDTKFIDQTKPQINDEEVFFEIHAASINPLDSKIRKVELKALLEYDLPLVLGNDFSGTVVEKGKNVTKFSIGDEVYGKPRSEKMGTFTEYIALNEAEIALKPTNLSFEEAVGIPLVD
jgi:alcohol dehydrogenase